MNDNTLSFLSALSERLGITITTIWQTLVHGTSVSGVIDTVHAIVLLIAGIVFGVKMYRAGEIHPNKGEGESRRIVGITGIVITVIVVSFYLNEALTTVFSPQGQALLRLLPYLAGK